MWKNWLGSKISSFKSYQVVNQLAWGLFAAIHSSLALKQRQYLYNDHYLPCESSKLPLASSWTNESISTLLNTQQVFDILQILLLQNKDF